MLATHYFSKEVSHMTDPSEAEQDSVARDLLREYIAAERSAATLVPPPEVIRSRVRRRRRVNYRTTGSAILAVVTVIAAAALAIDLQRSPATRPAASSPPSPTATFPASIYPPARTANAGGLGLCPNDSGITRGTRQQAEDAARAFAGASSVAQARVFSDRAWWPQLDPGDLQPGVSIAPTHMSIGPLAGSLRTTVTTFCGTTTANATWDVAVCTSGDNYEHCARSHPALVSDFLVLSRSGRQLVWLITGG